MKTITLDFDKDAVDLVIEGLAELQYKRVAGIISAVTLEARRQLARPEEPAPEAPTPPRRLPASRVKKVR